jgi:non-ribosomal peptide synthetase component F
MSGESDIIIGTEVLGRTQPELKDVVGTFVNVLPLRVQVRPEVTYLDFLTDVKECVVESFENQDFQFDQIVSLIGKDEIARNPIFDFYFSFSNTNDSDPELSELKFIPFEFDKRIKGEYEFSIQANEVNNSNMNVSFIYSNQLYDEETIKLMMLYYNKILKEILKDEKTRIDDIEIENLLANA